jgi:crossover junction endodeoxyribonuclease RuvC
MKILGIDPGTRVVGYGLIELKGTSLKPLACGLIRPPQNDPLSRRLRNIHDNISVVLKRTRPDVVAVEEIFFGRNVATLIKIGEARGVILSACAGAGVDVVGHAPAEVKKAVTGNGRAAKSQVREMVAVFLGKQVAMETDDVSDALAIAICHAHRSRLTELGID